MLKTFLSYDSGPRDSTPSFQCRGDRQGRVDERIDGELLLLNGAAFLSSATLNKAVSQSLLNETHVYTEDNTRFLHGHGVANKN
ncbi:hypothetical protein OIU84_002753 [Salix udensis]|uniref:Uncharacterized protein n=1 Tax=Salix udensis TaxID=889485 RepID=A0AAD6K4V5_9ROSI|nr:hypothetical protein OIU84_002753 [Salix udensis]